MQANPDVTRSVVPVEDFWTHDFWGNDMFNKREQVRRHTELPNDSFKISALSYSLAYSSVVSAGRLDTLQLASVGHSDFPGGFLACRLAGFSYFPRDQHHHSYIILPCGVHCSASNLRAPPPDARPRSIGAIRAASNPLGMRSKRHVTVGCNGGDIPSASDCCACIWGGRGIA